LGKNKEGDILKNEAITNGLKTIYGLRSAGSFVGMKPSEMDVADKLANEKAWRAVQQEFTRWAKANADKIDDPVWNEMVDEKIAKLTAPFEEKVTLGAWGRLWAGFDAAEAKELQKRRNEQIAKAVAGEGRAQITEETVSKYYDLANGDMAEARRLMKKDGFEVEE
jgi:hypothetical protein